MAASASVTIPVALTGGNFEIYHPPAVAWQTAIMAFATLPVAWQMAVLAGATLPMAGVLTAHPL